jgi:NAD(P)-dependent dehydrogenase (short-subunit alcohol dehydrogenase family)
MSLHSSKSQRTNVIATDRNTAAKGLTELVNNSPKGNINVIRLDVLDTASIQEAVAEVAKLLPGGLDVIISNAGVDSQPLVPFENL